MRSLVAFALLIGFASARAEHRVALVIGDEGEETGRTVAVLAKEGFRCETIGNLPDKELRRAIEDWSTRTPTNSTALLSFRGEVKSELHDGDPALALIANNNRPVPIHLVLAQMSSRGGSRTNLLVIDCPGTPEFSEEIPPHCAVSFGKLPAVPGKASLAISPPGRFVPGTKPGDEWVNDRGMVFCWCPPGKHLAGSPENTPGRHPDEEQREVTIKEGFWIGKYELTGSQNLRGRDRRSIATHKNHPVNMLHWDDGRGMLRRFTTEERRAGRLPAGWQYDLPTEEQWEYAARAGTTTRFYFGHDMNLLPRHANFADKSYYDSGDIFSNAAHRTLDDGYPQLAPAGSFLPNPWGLHDVYGNVVEWCRDHGARGGGWVSVPQNCRSAYRDSYSSRNEQIYLGYRLVIQPNAPELEKK